MNLEESIQVMRPAVEAGLQAFINRTLPEEYADMRQMLAYHMGWEGEGAGLEAQGKRIRPLVVLMAAEAAGGCWQDALPAALAVELLHNFSLIHDDIQDNSPLRRNRPTVWVRWGMPQAINAGDVMFTQSFLAIHDLSRSLPAAQVVRAGQLLQQTCLRLTQGQYLDISFETRREVTVEAYWTMISGKTSALLACSAQLGALAAGADETRQDLFREYGHSLGLAFQVLDDWLGIWGDMEQTGKSVESDLASGKKTLPVLYGLSQNGAFARRWLRGKIEPAEVPDLARQLETEGAYAYTLETASRLTRQALTALERATTGSLALTELTHALLKRQN